MILSPSGSKSSLEWDRDVSVLPSSFLSSLTGGIPWNLFSHLENLDFADDLDLAILSTNHSNLQEKTDRLEAYAK